MDQPLDWLPGAEGTVWVALGIAKQAGLPVPAGFIVFASTREQRIRSTYEELKIREKTYFVALRGLSHAVLNVLGPDQVMHALRRLWTEAPESPWWVNAMVTASGAEKHICTRRIRRIKPKEGRKILIPTTTLRNTLTGNATDGPLNRNTGR